VEFALIAPVLLALLFGIVDYGLYFADTLSVQQGLSTAARTATLAPADASGPQWGTATCPLQQAGAPDALPLQHLACSVLDEVEPVAGQLFVRAELVDADGQATQSWEPGSRLRLCAITEHPPVLPFVPLPAGGRILTRVDMPVQSAPAPVVMAPVSSSPPAGADWAWCAPAA
jgi:Flp pilus assembly protein TadG